MTSREVQITQPEDVRDFILDAISRHPDSQFDHFAYQTGDGQDLLALVHRELSEVWVITIHEAHFEVVSDD